MQRRGLVFGFLLIGLAAAYGAGALSAHRTTMPDGFGADAAIRELLTRQQSAWNSGDVDSFLRGYWESDQLTFSGSSGITRGYAGVRERYKKSYPDRQTMGKLEFSGLEVRELGANAALVLGHWHLDRQKGDIGGVFSLVLEHFPEGWRIVHDHTSVVLAPPAE